MICNKSSFFMMQTSGPTRREFLKTASMGLAAAAFAPHLADVASAATAAPEPTPSKLPRWRGFNLLEKFTDHRNEPFREADFEWIAELGFDFVRLPMSYRCWADPGDWLKLKKPILKQVDQAVEFGRKYGVHVNINFHRAPGYCVNPPDEPRDLWTDEEAVRATCFHWAHFAERYKGIPNSRLSFDLLNEPKDMDEGEYVRVVRRMVEAIREVDPERLIIADGLRWGRKPVMSLAGDGIAQSTRGYDPMRISHWKASWVNGEKWPEPTWPLLPGKKDEWNQARLMRELIQPWKVLAEQGVGVHVGEWGAYRYTPHQVALAWMRDLLSLWREQGWGWALWNFRGSFGILDSQREDVNYENWRGHKLDRAMLELLQSA